jgi:hypothetical protein
MALWVLRTFRSDITVFAIVTLDYTRSLSHFVLREKQFEVRSNAAGRQP